MQYPGVGRIYSRLSHPPSMHLESVIARIEGVDAGDCLTVASGTTATFYTVMNLCDPGDNMIASLELYGGTMAMFKAFLPSLGIEIRWVDLSDTKALEEAIDDKTRGVFSELLANSPHLTVLGYTGCQASNR